MRLSQIHKIYLSNFLTGLVFWYGIEKLFMGSIGIDAVGVGLATAVFLGFTFLFDIPSGILADRWSRKGMLVVSALALGLCSLVAALSHNLGVYVISSVLYGVYIVASSGTYQALMYDSLHAEGRAKSYSMLMGRAYALFLAGAGFGNLASGFLAQQWGFRTAFLLTIVSCVINIAVMLTLYEPTFHKAEQKEKVLSQLKVVISSIARLKLLCVLVVVFTALAVSDLFMNEFSQLYILRYLSTPQLLGAMWALGAFGLALGSFIAHRFRARLNWLILGVVLPYIFMSFIDHSSMLVFFVLQAIASAALLNQIETRLQEVTPSAVRASVLSVASAMGRALCIPTSFIIGWLIRDYGVLWAVRFVALISVLALIYWGLSSRKMRTLQNATTASGPPADSFLTP